MSRYPNTPSGLVVSTSGNGTKAASQTALANPEFRLPFFYYLTVPKSTTQTSPLIVEFNLPIGIINRLWLEFPRGVSGLAGVQIYRGVTQVFPLPAGVWFRSDNAVFNFAFSHDMTTEPYFIELRGYNDDDTYQHTIWIGFEMSGKPSDLSPQLQGLLNYLKG